MPCDFTNSDFNLVSPIQNTNTFIPIKTDFDLNSTTLNAFANINMNSMNSPFQYNNIYKNNSIENNNNNNNQISNQIPNIAINNNNYMNNFDLLNNNILFQNYNDSSSNLLPPYCIINNNSFPEPLNNNIGNMIYDLYKIYLIIII